MDREFTITCPRCFKKNVSVKLGVIAKHMRKRNRWDDPRVGDGITRIVCERSGRRTEWRR